MKLKSVQKDAAKIRYAPCRLAERGFLRRFSKPTEVCSRCLATRRTFVFGAVNAMQ